MIQCFKVFLMEFLPASRLREWEQSHSPTKMCHEGQSHKRLTWPWCKIPTTINVEGIFSFIFWLLLYSFVQGFEWLVDGHPYICVSSIYKWNKYFGSFSWGEFNLHPKVVKFQYTNCKILWLRVIGSIHEGMACVGRLALYAAKFWIKIFWCVIESTGKIEVII